MNGAITPQKIMLIVGAVLVALGIGALGMLAGPKKSADAYSQRTEQRESSPEFQKAVKDYNDRTKNVNMKAVAGQNADKAYQPEN